MTNTIILSQLSELKITKRIAQIVTWYLTSILVASEKHGQSFAGKISQKCSSLFSHLLKKHLQESKMILGRMAKRRLCKLSRIRSSIIQGAPWTVAIIIDATLHERSSRKCQNVQKFTHGKGWINGHQWTNIGILINNSFVPLPPLPFYTEEECLRRGIEYKTEPEKICHFLQSLSLKDYIGDHSPDEVVVLMDSGHGIPQKNWRLF